jgi:hypothetical protein
MGKVIWKLRRYIEERGISPAELEREIIRLGYNWGAKTIYRFVRDDGPVNANRDTLAALIEALRSLTGRKVNIQDLLEYEQEKGR